MPFHSFGLWEAVMIAPPSRSWLAAWKYSMSVPTMPMSVTAQPWLRAPRTKPAAISGEDTRASLADGDAFGPQIVDEGAADAARDLAVELAGVDPADVVGLEDTRLDHAVPSVRSE